MPRECADRIWSKLLHIAGSEIHNVDVTLYELDVACRTLKYMDYGHEKGRFYYLSAHYVTILNPIHVIFSCSTHLWVELDALIGLAVVR